MKQKLYSDVEYKTYITSFLDAVRLTERVKRDANTVTLTPVLDLYEGVVCFPARTPQRRPNIMSNAACFLFIEQNSHSALE